jgi:hypothetical protein
MKCDVSFLSKDVLHIYWTIHDKNGQFILYRVPPRSTDF